MNAPFIGLGAIASNAGAFGRGAIALSIIVHGGIAAAFVGWGEPAIDPASTLPVAIVAVPATMFDEPAATAAQPIPDLPATAAETADHPPPAPMPDPQPVETTPPAALPPSDQEQEAEPSAAASDENAADAIDLAAAPPPKPDAPPEPAAAVAIAAPAPTAAPAIADTPPQPESETATQIASLPNDTAAETDEVAREPAFEPARFDVAALANPEPDYPWVSRQRGEEGRVLLRVEVTAEGEVARIEVAESSGHRRLDEAALEAVAEWRFEPARIGENPIATTVNVPITFRLEN